jgi:CO/xanthine dehydrogenase Mo-binding subunit
VAAVVAASSGLAQDALAMIDVEYETLPAVMDLEKAVEGGTPPFCSRFFESDHYARILTLLHVLVAPAA